MCRDIYWHPAYRVRATPSTIPECTASTVLPTASLGTCWPVHMHRTSMAAQNPPINAQSQRHIWFQNFLQYLLHYYIILCVRFWHRVFQTGAQHRHPLFFQHVVVFVAIFCHDYCARNQRTGCNFVRSRYVGLYIQYACIQYVECDILSTFWLPTSIQWLYGPLLRVTRRCSVWRGGFSSAHCWKGLHWYLLSRTAVDFPSGPWRYETQRDSVWVCKQKNLSKIFQTLMITELIWGGFG